MPSILPTFILTLPSHLLVNFFKSPSVINLHYTSLITYNENRANFLIKIFNCLKTPSAKSN